jgi:hypothetical protein
VQTLGLVMTLLIVFLPLALIWVAVITLRSVRDLRAEAARLQAAVDAMRASYVQNASQVQAAAMKPSRERSWTRSPRPPGRPKPCWPPLPAAATRR